jgi:hypothetical protein
MKHYKLLDGPHSVAKMSATLGASVALTLWMAHRGPDDGFLFCNFVCERLNYGRLWDAKFIQYMRERLILAGEVKKMRAILRAIPSN